MRSPVAFLKKKKTPPLLTFVDDDLSNSSTLTTGSYHKPQQVKTEESSTSTTTTLRSPHRRSSSIARISSKVRFDETRNDASLTAANSHYQRECWYLQKELVHFKKSVILLGRKLLNSSKPVDCTYRRVLTCTYHLCSSVQYEVDTTKGSILCPRDQADLRKCVDGEDATSSSTPSSSYLLERMGLDRLTVPVLMEENNHSKKRAVSHVKEIQQKPSFQQLPFHTQCQVLQAALEPVSRPGRLLAREMARALAKSCVASPDAASTSS